MAWVVVMLAGIPAVAMGIAMLHGVRGKVVRTLLISAGALLAGVLLLLVTGLDLLVGFGYSLYAVLSLFTAPETGRKILGSWT